MAITAKFQADFSTFKAAVDAADIQLRGFEGNANKVGTSLNKVADSFSGRKIIQEAELAAKAIEAMGGVTKLNADKQEEANRILEKAIEQYRVLGKEAPAALVNIQGELDKTLNGWKSFQQDFKPQDAIKHPVDSATGAVQALATSMGPVGVAGIALAGALTATATAAFGLAEKAAAVGA